MLLLSRKAAEQIVIGHEIFVTVCSIQGNRVQFAIDAPPNGPIRRGELSLKAAASPPSEQDSPVIPVTQNRV